MEHLLSQSQKVSDRGDSRVCRDGGEGLGRRCDLVCNSSEGCGQAVRPERADVHTVGGKPHFGYRMERAIAQRERVLLRRGRGAVRVEGGGEGRGLMHLMRECVERSDGIVVYLIVNCSFEDDWFLYTL